MILYPLDTNVLQEMHAGGHPKVLAWLATVNDHQLRYSVITFHESRLGLERERLRRKGKDASDIEAKLTELDASIEELADRTLGIDSKISSEWARMLAASGKNDRDTALAATARVHDLVLVTRNIKHVAGRDILALDPFVNKPAIRRV
ncbi:MAG TPA: PIN domain-containing protein [Allosphingosinicella sp.]